MKETFDFAVLRKYAEKKRPDKMSPNIYFMHTKYTVTVYDLYPKAMYHFLLLPRLGPPPYVAPNLVDLRTLLNSKEVSKREAEALLNTMKEDAEKVKEQIEQEMINTCGFKWEIWMGFHPAPSLEHLHLHIISSELDGKGLKKPVHYNSFHPKLGYFLHLDEVLEWFEAVETVYNSKRTLYRAQYREKRNAPLECFRCFTEHKDMPTLKTHLHEHFLKIAEEEKARAERRRKFEEAAEQRKRRRLEMERQREEELQGDDVEGAGLGVGPSGGQAPSSEHVTESVNVNMNDA